MTEPLRILVSRRVAEGWGDRMTAIAERAGRPVEPVVFDLVDLPSNDERDSLEAAFYSRDVWEGCDKSYVNPETTAFFELVDNAPGLRWLQVTSAGVDLPMYDRSHARGVRVTSSSGGNAAPISLSVLTGLLSIARGFTHWRAAQHRHEWAMLQGETLPHDVTGQTAVIVGMGPIGLEIGRLLATIGMRTVGIRRTPAPADHFDEVRTFDDFDDVLPTCDWLILACPLTDTTRGLVTEKRLAALPRGAGFVNIARGECVEDEQALVDALRDGHLLGAYLDVFAVEPLPDDSPLWDMENVIVTPHNCSASAGNFPRGVEIFLRNLEHYLAGEPLENEPRAKAATR